MRVRRLQLARIAMKGLGVFVLAFALILWVRSYLRSDALTIQAPFTPTESSFGQQSFGSNWGCLGWLSSRIRYEDLSGRPMPWAQADPAGASLQASASHPEMKRASWSSGPARRDGSIGREPVPWHGFTWSRRVSSRLARSSRMRSGGKAVVSPAFRRSVEEQYISVPYWLLLFVGGLPFVFWMRGVMQARSRARNGLCSGCGYDLRETSGRCPECGLTRLGRSTISTEASLE